MRIKAVVLAVGLVMVSPVASAAACKVSIFPEKTQSLRFLQTTRSALGEAAAELTFRDRTVRGTTMRWKQTFTVEGRAARDEVSEFRCSKEGITPMAEGTDFTGVQYGNDLAPDGGWTWTWAATGISASYDYRVAGKEKVTVPAGTFDAVRVNYTAKVLSETRGELGPIRGTLWIVEGVGLVKQYEDDPAATSVLPQTITLELLAVTASRP
jgi:hypothetical protein